VSPFVSQSDARKYFCIHRPPAAPPATSPFLVPLRREAGLTVSLGEAKMFRRRPDGGWKFSSVLSNNSALRSVRSVVLRCHDQGRCCTRLKRRSSMYSRASDAGALARRLHPWSLERLTENRTAWLSVFLRIYGGCGKRKARLPGLAFSYPEQAFQPARGRCEAAPFDWLRSPMKPFWNHFSRFAKNYCNVSSLGLRP